VYNSSEKKLNFAKIQISATAFPRSYLNFHIKFDRYLLHALVPHKICFKNPVDLRLFCGEDLIFGAFLKYFMLGL
jgi:hypothetical protein